MFADANVRCLAGSALICKNRAKVQAYTFALFLLRITIVHLRLYGANFTHCVNFTIEDNFTQAKPEFHCEVSFWRFATPFYQISAKNGLSMADTEMFIKASL